MNTMGKAQEQGERIRVCQKKHWKKFCTVLEQHLLGRWDGDRWWEEKSLEKGRRNRSWSEASRSPHLMAWWDEGWEHALMLGFLRVTRLSAIIILLVKQLRLGLKALSDALQFCSNAKLICHTAIQESSIKKVTHSNVFMINTKKTPRKPFPESVLSRREL